MTALRANGVMTEAGEAIPYRVNYDRYTNTARRIAFSNEAATLAPELRRIADKYGYSPHTVAKIAVARAGK